MAENNEPAVFLQREETAAKIYSFFGDRFRRITKFSMGHLVLPTPEDSGGVIYVKMFPKYSGYHTPDYPDGWEVDPCEQRVVLRFKDGRVYRDSDEDVEDPVDKLDCYEWRNEKLISEITKGHARRICMASIVTPNEPAPTIENPQGLRVTASKEHFEILENFLSLMNFLRTPKDRALVAQMLSYRYYSNFYFVRTDEEEADCILVTPDIIKEVPYMVPSYTDKMDPYGLSEAVQLNVGDGLVIASDRMNLRYIKASIFRDTYDFRTINGILTPASKLYGVDIPSDVDPHRQISGLMQKKEFRFASASMSVSA